MKDERLRMLQDMPIFGGLREDVLGFLVDRAVEVSLAEGEFLFSENDPGDAMYVLEEGSVAVLKRWKKIWYRISYLGAGDCIGEMSLIDLGRRSASVLAVTDCKALKLTSASIFELFQQDLEQFALIQMNLSRELSRRLRIADEALFQELIQTNQIPRH